MKNIIKLETFAFLCLVTSSFGQTVWTDGGLDQSWVNPVNWNPASVPINTTAVQIGTQPTGDQIGVDTGGATTVASFTFNNTLTASVDIAPLTIETLQVNGAITNNSAFANSFSLAVTAGASATWSGPLSFTAQVVFGTSQITLNDAISFTGSNINFDITNASTYGRFLGAGTATVAGVTINIGGAYTGVASDTFDFSSGNFSGATLGTLPTLGGGLTWDSSNFLTNGTLAVVPEPPTWAFFATGLTALMVLRPRRRRR